MFYKNFIFTKMFYWTGVTKETIPLKFRNFGYEILLDEYKNMMNSTLPLPDDCS